MIPAKFNQGTLEIKGTRPFSYPFGTYEAIIFFYVSNILFQDQWGSKKNPEILKTIDSFRAPR